MITVKNSVKAKKYLLKKTKQQHPYDKEEKQTIIQRIVGGAVLTELICAVILNLPRCPYIDDDHKWMQSVYRSVYH